MKRKAEDAVDGNKHSLLLPPHFREDIKEYLRQDMPIFDIGAFVVGDKPMVGHLLAKTDGVLAAVPFFNAVFDELGCTVEWLCSEGQLVGPSHMASEAAAKPA